MPRRRRNRRQRLERQEQRQEAEAAGVPVSEEAAPSSEGTTGGGISFSGASGGLLGAGMFFALAMELLIDPGDVSRLAAIAWAFIGLCFLPAIWVSVVRNHPQRRRVLRITTVGVMVLAMLSLFLGLGFSLAVLLAPSTALLAVGAGFIFQRSGSSS
ncbi:MAG: hypothetical protein IIC86_08620 [Chloroflexi bacterium]|nr:hypothetical protein [Chloroflexota bacterium]